jgi:hypothetical protein
VLTASSRYTRVCSEPRSRSRRSPVLVADSPVDACAPSGRDRRGIPVRAAGTGGHPPSTPAGSRACRPRPPPGPAPLRPRRRGPTAPDHRQPAEEPLPQRGGGRGGLGQQESVPPRSLPRKPRAAAPPSSLVKRTVSGGQRREFRKGGREEHPGLQPALRLPRRSRLARRTPRAPPCRPGGDGARGSASASAAPPSTRVRVPERASALVPDLLRMTAAPPAVHTTKKSRRPSPAASAASRGPGQRHRCAAAARAAPRARQRSPMS